MNRHGFSEKKNHVGPYFYLEISSLDSWIIRTVLKIHKYKYRSYDKRYERGSGYRQTFFESNNGPYRCAYCGKRLKDDYIEVDHLIPVSKAKTSTGVRTWLQLCGIKNVNDARNLVASCKKCNRKKSDKTGFWVIRGAIGRYNIIWTIKDIVVTLVIICVAYILYVNWPTLKNLITLIPSFFQ
jgi:5-methylcytosine-specific restriction endonuclease McrA